VVVAAAADEAVAVAAAAASNSKEYDYATNPGDLVLRDSLLFLIAASLNGQDNPVHDDLHI